MGVNTNLYVIKPLGNKQWTAGELLQRLGIPAISVGEALDFETTLSRLWDKTFPDVLAVTPYADKLIIIDDAENIDKGLMPGFTRDLPAEVLQMDNSDTMGVSGFSFWSEGELLRKQAGGLNEWKAEFEAAGITDEAILATLEDVDFGDPLEIEKEPGGILAAYALDYFDFYNLKWSTYRIDRQPAPTA